MRLHEFVVKKKISVAVFFTDGASFLACKPTNINYWELPKGQQDENEQPIDTAIREFKEETNYPLKEANLNLIGKFPFHLTKEVILYTYKVDKLPPINRFKCKSYTKHYGDPVLEIERFKYIKFDDYLDLRWEFFPSVKKAIRSLKGA